MAAQSEKAHERTPPRLSRRSLGQHRCGLLVSDPWPLCLSRQPLDNTRCQERPYLSRSLLVSDPQLGRLPQAGDVRRRSQLRGVLPKGAAAQAAAAAAATSQAGVLPKGAAAQVGAALTTTAQAGVLPKGARCNAALEICSLIGTWAVSISPIYL